MHQEIVTLRQVLKTAVRHGWLDHLPDLSAALQGIGQDLAPGVVLARGIQAALRGDAQARARTRSANASKWESEQLHDYVLFMANTGLRPDEATRLEYRDVTIVEDDATDETILEIEVRGKRGVGYCKSMPGAVAARSSALVETQQADSRPTQRRSRDYPPANCSTRSSTKTNLKFDREGSRRTAYSLRHTYICLRLMEGADIYQIAKNCRTSVEMIEKYYASHIKTQPGRGRDQRHAASRSRTQKPAETSKAQRTTG